MSFNGKVFEFNILQALLKYFLRDFGIISAMQDLVFE